jgi:manganese oxidase
MASRHDSEGKAMIFSATPSARNGWTAGAATACLAARKQFGIQRVAAVLLVASLLGGCATPTHEAAQAETCKRVIQADVVALEQAYLLNRFAAFVPAGMMFALRDDVVAADGSGVPTPGNAMLRPDKRPRPLVLRVNEGDCLQVTLENLLTPQWQEEGGVPREYGGRLPAHVESRAGSPTSRTLVRANAVSLDAPRTRLASLHVTGLELEPIPPAQCPVDMACGGAGMNAGLASQQGLAFNPGTSAAARAAFGSGSLAGPGQKVVTRWRAAKEGTYFAYSTAAPVGGEGDGGQIGLGLFAAVNVEPAGSRWYRSQITHEQMKLVQRSDSGGAHPGASIDYDKTEVIRGRHRPVLAMLDGDRLVHSDLNALIVQPEGDGKGANSPHCRDMAHTMFGDSCGLSFREFTVILHDEIHAQQAFAELEDPDNPLHYLKDGMGINYGASSMGSLAMSTPLQRKVGVAAGCPECRAEEFFLSSWANGDPALILAYDAQGQRPIGARYKDDPSNVHHSYLGDPVRFRNLHAGPKETHVFHLHAHQWVLDSNDPNSTYLDSQTISPGATFSYGIEFGGSGNRNFTPGDSIFHCHLYPHFAQGMWELWRTHDTFEDGNDQGVFDPDQPAGPANDPRWRRLPDAEIPANAALGIRGGVESPALVPIPGQALAPLPSPAFAGYPFYIPGKAGHRPPQPVLDMDVADASYNQSDFSTEPDADKVVDGGLPRHVVQQGSTIKTAREDNAVREHALSLGGEAAQVIARRVAAQDPIALQAFAAGWDQLNLKPLPHSGTPGEKAAMTFHEGGLTAPGFTPAAGGSTRDGQWWPHQKGYKTSYAATTAIQTARQGDAVFHVNGLPRAPGAPYANPCPVDAPMRNYRAAFIQTELTYNKHGWFDPQGRIVILEHDIKDIIDPATRTRLPEPLFFRANSGECIDFKSSNFVPPALNADDFQVFTPTDTIGQHIHLVKFDVTSSDGSGNGWNYEDATFSPGEVRERIFAFNRTPNADGSAKTAAQRLKPKAHPLFSPGGDIWVSAGGNPEHPLLKRGLCPDPAPGESDEHYEHRLNTDHPLCGAQRTTQRWWADPIINRQNGKDNTLRTVFTHDHMGPSSHQQHGLYAGLVIEPANSVWTRVNQSVTAEELGQAGAQLAAGASLNCDRPAGDTSRSTLCNKVLGGSDLSQPTRPALRADTRHVLSAIEPREPLRLRGDGGPTATLANIISPACAGDGDSSVLQPATGRNRSQVQPCPDGKRNDQTRREFALAIADFGIAYNTALEPINPEPRGDTNNMRDLSSIRFGRRHVAMTPARPLGISSEDPGSQYFNYRHEPLALRISEATPQDPARAASDPQAALGGFDYTQSQRRAYSDQPCKPGDQDCLGDMANAFSTDVHARRDERLAKEPLQAHASQSTRELLRSLGWETQLDKVLRDVEQWRRDFNCALYNDDEQHMPKASPGKPGCAPRIARLEPWRTFGDPATPILPAFEGDQVQIRLIQGAQEAQHIFAMNGVKWKRIPDSAGSGFTNAQPIGISEHFEFNVLVDPLGMPHTDHLFYASSIDQLWDGAWGLLRSFRAPEPPVAGVPAPAIPHRAVFTSAGLAALPDAASHRGLPVVVGHGGLAAIAPPPNAPIVDKSDLCTDASGQDVPRRFFDVSVARACQLIGDCDTAGSRGLTYSTRHRIEDPQGMVYVLNREVRCNTADACDREEAQAVNARSHAATLTTLRQEFAGGRPLEPLVLRAAAGECLQVFLRNHLTPSLPDGPMASGDPKLPLLERSAYHNALPMITDGFNLNQFQMSSTVGMSVPRLTQNPVWGDGSHVGLNGATRLAPELRGDLTLQRDQMPNRQGTLAPACGAGQENPDRCATTYLWSTLDLASKRQPVEFGALPIASFGDVIKHPTHGLIGAVVIGPQGSEVCADNRFARGGGQLALDQPTRLSAEICKADGSRYVDHVLVMQDAVSALHGDLPVHDLSGAEEPDDRGMKAINYKTEPLWARRGSDPTIGFSERNEMDYAGVFSSAEGPPGPGGVVRCAAGIKPVLALKHPCDPETPVLTARAGEKVRLHVVHAGGHTRQQGLALAGHAWNPYPWSSDSHRFEASSGSSIRQGVYNGFGPMMGISLEITAGGAGAVPMDYLFRSQASFLLDGGLWGLLRVENGAAPQRP